MPTIAQLSVVDRINLDLRNQLKLSFLGQTDNPNVKIEFTDPSPDAKGVQLSVDGGESKVITSPYTIETLKIGPHQLGFKFTDANGLEQELSETLLIYPRQPVIDKNTEQVDAGTVKIKGTSIGNSTIELLIHTPSEIVKGVATTDGNGAWTYEFKYEFVQGAYSIVGVTNYEGYRSVLSEALTFKVETGDSEAVAPVLTNTVRAPELSVRYFRENPKIAGGALALLLAGLVVGIILNNILFYRRKKFFENLFQSAIRSDDRDRRMKIPESRTAKVEPKRIKEEAVADKPLSKLKKMEQENSLRHMDFARGAAIGETVVEDEPEDEMRFEESQPQDIEEPQQAEIVADDIIEEVEVPQPSRSRGMLNKISQPPVSRRKRAETADISEYLSPRKKAKPRKQVTKAASDRTKRGSIKIDIR